MFQLSIWSIPPLLTMLVCVGTYLRLRTKQRVPGMPAILALLTAVVFWSMADFLGTLFADPAIKFLITKISYFGIVIVPVAWFAFAISYTRRQLRLPRAVLNLISLIPLLTLILVMTNEWHQLVWTDARLVSSHGYVGLVTDHGTWFYVHAAYSYLLIIIATTILAWTLGQTSGEWKPVLAVVATPLVVGAANLFYFLPINPSPWFDTTTLGFAIAAMILDGGVLRYGVLDSIPVLRDRVVEQLSDGVAVINHQGMIIDINASALAIFGTNRSKASSKPITRFVKTVSLENLIGERPQNLEVTIGQQAYDVSATSLDKSNPQADVVLVFRNVTKRRKTEQDLLEAQDELVRLAHTDYLTGLHNRRFFMQRLQEEVERVRRHNSNLSVVLLDLDLFKGINDTCGHDAGDLVLKMVADATSEIKRITDVAARVGGEEFALLLPETDQRGAVQLAQRLREAIAALAPTEIVEAGLTITASFGVATVGPNSKDVDNILYHADEALYKAKASGRNAVCCAELTGVRIASRASRST